MRNQNIWNILSSIAKCAEFLVAGYDKKRTQKRLQDLGLTIVGWIC